jgi:uncharacterized protein YndB with AHSA1/START domain
MSRNPNCGHFFDGKIISSACAGSFGFDFAGTYTKVVPNALIEYSFGERTGIVEFNAVESGVSVRVTFEAEQQYPVAQQRQGWQAILNNFSKHVQQQR